MYASTGQARPTASATSGSVWSVSPATSAATAPVIDPAMMSADSSWRRRWVWRRATGGSSGRNASWWTSVVTLSDATGSADVAFVLKAVSLLGRGHHAQDY